MTVLISPAELKEALGPDVVIIDTRDPESFRSGHIAGAVNMHDIFTYLATSSPEGVAEMSQKFAEEFGAAGLDGEKTAVLCEQSMNTGFGQSCRGYFILKYLGYPKAKILHGGVSAWSAAGYDLHTAPLTPTPATFPIDPAAASIMLTQADIQAVLGDEKIALLDVRDVDEWIADSSSPYGKDFCPRKGRIPGAKWIEWYRFMKPSADGPMIKSPDEVMAECASVGITKDTPVYLYCFKGARASNTLVALKEAGVKDVRLYFGSWNEWSRDETLPIEAGLPFAAE